MLSSICGGDGGNLLKSANITAAFSHAPLGSTDYGLRTATIAFSPFPSHRGRADSGLFCSLITGRSNLYLTIPPSLHDSCNAGGIVTATLVDLHGQGGSGMAGINTDHRQAPLCQLPPQPKGVSEQVSRSCFRQFSFSIRPSFM